MRLLDVGDLDRNPAFGAEAYRCLSEAYLRLPQRGDRLIAQAMTRTRFEYLGCIIVFIDGPARVGLRKLDRMGDDRLQHGLHVERGTDSPTDFTEGMHFFDRACERIGTCREFPEHSHVFDGNHRLICEGVEQIDVLFREGPRRCA